MGESMISTFKPLGIIASFILAVCVGRMSDLAVVESRRAAEVLKKDMCRSQKIYHSPALILAQFVDIGSRECYVGMLYSCYDLIPLPVVMDVKR